METVETLTIEEEREIMRKAIMALRDLGLSRVDIAKELSPRYPNLTYDQVYNRVKKLFYKLENKEIVEVEDPEFFAGNDDITLKRVVSNPNYDVYDIWTKAEGKMPSKEEIIEACGVDTTKYQIKDYTYEEVMRNTADGPAPFYKVKVRVEPKKTLQVEDLDKTIKVECKRIPIKKRNLKEETLAVINFADIHFGMYASESETGMLINNDVMKARFEKTISDFVNYVNKIGATKVRFVTLGDVVHVDNSKQTTTSGTPQQIDGRLCDITSMAIEELVSACDTILRECNVTMDYVYVPGNHDRDIGQVIAYAVQQAFRNEPNITFDVSGNPFKFKEFGKTFVGYHHGDCNLKTLDMGQFYNTEEKAKHFAACPEKEFHLGHLHHKESNILPNGIVIRYMPSISGASAWEYQQGFSSSRGTVFEEYNINEGKIGEYISKI